MTGGSSSYLDTPTLLLLVGGMAVALVCLVRGLGGHAPGRLTLGLTTALQLAVVVYAGSYLGRQLGGASPAGPAWELWAYLVMILFLPALAIIWAREEPSRWSTFVLAVAAFTVAVMGARCAQIWAGLGIMPGGGA